MANSIIADVLGGKSTFKVTSKFGGRSAPVKGASTFHNAVDVGVPVGTPIYAPEDGVFSGNDTAKGGVQAFVSGANGNRYGFAHLSKRVATPGTRVKKGQLIGYTGNTGIGTGAHLHFTVTDRAGRKVNPESVTSTGAVPQSAPVTANAPQPQPQTSNPWQSLLTTLAPTSYGSGGTQVPVVNMGGQLAMPENKAEHSMFASIANDPSLGAKEPIIANAAAAIAQAQSMQNSVSLLPDSNPLRSVVDALFDEVKIT